MFKNSISDVESHINALKINWIRRIAQGDKKWIKLFKLTVNLTNDDICCMGLSRFNVMKSTIHNKFWHDALLSWSSLISIANNDNLDFNRIAKQYLWWNDKIKIGGRSVKYIHWKERGVVFINDLLKDNGTLMSREEFEKVFNVKTNFLEYTGIIRAIKSSFNIHNLNGSKPISPFLSSNMELICKQRKGCKLFYDMFVRSKRVKKLSKWQLEFGIEDNDWRDLCKLNFKSISDTKYRWFQYRINQNILATNSLLQKMNIKEDDTLLFVKVPLNQLNIFL